MTPAPPARAWAARLAPACAASLTLACGGAASDAAEAPPPGAEEASAESEPDPAPGPDAARLDAVQAAVNEASPAMHECWGRAAATDRDVEGELVLELEVGRGGRPAAVEVVRDTSSDDVLRACLIEVWEGRALAEGAFEPGDVLRLPPFRFVAPEVQFAIPARHIEAREIAGGAARARVVLREESTGNGAAALARVDVRPGEGLAAEGADAVALVYAAAGEGQVFGPGEESGAAFGAGDAARAPPGAAIGFEAAEGDPLELVWVYAPAGAEAALGAAEPEAREAARSGGADPIAVRRGGEVSAHDIAAGLGEARIYFDGDGAGGERASLTLLTAEPTMAVPPHAHEEASEYLYLLRGQGDMEAGEEAFAVSAGVGIQVPAGVTHGVEVTGEEPLEAVQIYAPAGPEQRFAGED